MECPDENFTLLNLWDHEANCLISREDSSSFVSSSSSEAKWWYRSERAKIIKSSLNIQKKQNAYLKVPGHTVKVAGVILGLQLRDEFSFLSQESGPVKTLEEGMLFDLWSSTCNSFHKQSG